MSKSLKERVKRVVGTVTPYNVEQGTAKIGSALNINADVLKDLIDKVDCLEEELKQIREKNNGS